MKSSKKTRADKSVSPALSTAAGQLIKLIKAEKGDHLRSLADELISGTDQYDAPEVLGLSLERAARRLERTTVTKIPINAHLAYSSLQKVLARVQAGDSLKTITADLDADRQAEREARAFMDYLNDSPAPDFVNNVLIDAAHAAAERLSVPAPDFGDTGPGAEASRILDLTRLFRTATRAFYQGTERDQ